MVKLSHEFDQQLYDLLLRRLKSPKAIQRLLRPPNSIPLIEAKESIGGLLPEKTVAGITPGELSKGGMSLMGGVGFRKVRDDFGLHQLGEGAGER